MHTFDLNELKNLIKHSHILKIEFSKHHPLLPFFYKFYCINGLTYNQLEQIVKLIESKGLQLDKITSDEQFIVLVCKEKEDQT